MIEVAASVVWVIAVTVVSVQVAVGEIVGLVVGGMVGEVVGCTTVDGTVGDAVGEVGASLRCCWAGDRVGGPVWWCWCSKRDVWVVGRSVFCRCGIGGVGGLDRPALSITSDVVGLVHGVVFVWRIVLVRYVVFVDVYVVLDQGWGAFH